MDKETKVKICGITNTEDALVACGAGADLVGFLFAEESPRFMEIHTVREIIDTLPESVGKVGLFKDKEMEKVKACVLNCGLDHVQLHGGESPEYCRKLKSELRGVGKEIKILKTFKVKDHILGEQPDTYEEADYYLFDTYHPQMMGGTGLKFDWNVLKDFRGSKPYFLAGGLNPENVAQAVSELRPFGVDVASGVEAFTGKKDSDKIKEFVRNAKEA